MLRFVIFTLASSVALAQELPDLPSCATSCLADFTTGSNIGGCARLDAKCICSSDSFLDGIACCLADACDKDDQATAVDYATKFCKTQGVEVPSQVVCKSGSQPSATTTTGGNSPSATTGAGGSASTSEPPDNAGPRLTSGAAPGLVGAVAAALVFL